MRIEKIINSDGLYTKYKLADFSEEELLNLLLHHSSEPSLDKLKSLDNQCVVCNQPTTFISTENDSKFLTDILVELKAVSEGAGEQKTQIRKQALIKILHRIGSFKRVFHCPRYPGNNAHSHEFHFIVFENEFIKAGQYPSIANKMNAGIKKYRLLNDGIYEELNRAIGLFSHSIGIGSFVYLRRIVEKYIVVPALQRKITDGYLETSELASTKFREKLSLIKSDLPKFLIDNTKLYSILSKGIHELSEMECLEMFPILRNAIELILDEEIELREKMKREKHVKRELDGM